MSSALAQATNIHHWAPFYVFRWIGYWSGIANEGGKGYGFWSGIGSCMSYLSIPAGLWKRHNCHVHWCPWLWHHEVTGPDGITHRVCHRHRGRKRRLTAAQLEEALHHHALFHRSGSTPHSHTVEQPPAQPLRG